MVDEGKVEGPEFFSSCLFPLIRTVVFLAQFLCFFLVWAYVEDNWFDFLFFEGVVAFLAYLIPILGEWLVFKGASECAPRFADLAWFPWTMTAFRAALSLDLLLSLALNYVRSRTVTDRIL